ncbi:MAG: cation transporter [Eubacteriaceae bacterium]|nr:cation transporter [Eubacteriaceae bacterium]
MEKNHSSSANILIALFMNLLFVAVEVVGGLITNSIAILSDSIHDFGDSLSIALAYILEKVSEKKPNDEYTYGYRRYSLISAVITSLILVAGSVTVVIAAIGRIKKPEVINGKLMIVISVFGVVLNGAAALKTHKGSGANERAISLHMLEDVLGWAVVLIGSLFISLFDLYIIDPLLSICVAAFLFYESVKTIMSVVAVLLEKVPGGFDMEDYKADLGSIEGIGGIHHVHVWSFDGEDILSSVHIDLPEDITVPEMNRIRKECSDIADEHGITHMTVQFDFGDCDEIECEEGEAHEVHGHSHMHGHDHVHGHAH